MARTTDWCATAGRLLLIGSVVVVAGSCNPEHSPTSPRRTAESQPLAAVVATVTANPGGPYTGVEGTAITFDGTKSTGTGLKYSWDFGDGTRDSTATPTHTYADNKTFTVKLYVTDVNGVKSTTAQTTATVANVPPVLADLLAPTLAPRAGMNITLSTTFTDAGTADRHTGTFAWGDTKTSNASVKETNGSGTASGSHSYAAAGTYAVSLRLVDDDGGADTATLTLVVGPKNQQPKANAGGPYTGVEGSPVSFDGTGSSDPDGDPLSYDWDFGDTTPHDTTATPTHVYADNKAYTVKLTVTDSYGSKSTVSQTTATISNAPPVITSFTGPATNPVAGTAMSVQGAFTDAGTRDTHSAAVDWGDGSTSAATDTESGGSGTITATHTYAAAGQYTLQLRVTDNGGAADTATLLVTVDPPAPPPTGDLAVSATTSGSNLDPDGYTVTVDGDATTAQPIAINGSVTFAKLAAGSHSVALSGIAANCTTTSNPRTVSITAGTTTSTSFAVSCTTISSGGAVAVTASTVGADFDPDGYLAILDSGTTQAVTQPVASNGSVTFANVTTGSHTVTLSGFADNCSIGITQQTVSVTTGATSQASFAVFCMAAHASTYTFVGAGDIADCALTDDEATAAVLGKIVAGEPGTVVYTIGDNVYDAATASEIANCYVPNWGQQKVRTFATLGNHEYKVDPNPTWDYFGTRAGQRGVGYYSYNIGDYWHIIVLNDNASYGGPARTAGSPQDLWLQADLASNTRPCILAMWHQPFVSSNNWYSASRKIYWDRLYAAGADIVLNGHLHYYERMYPQTPDLVRDDANGITQFIVGTGGAVTYTPDTLTANTVTVAPSRGVLKLTLGAGTYSWQFVWAAGQTYTDSGSGTCH